MKLPVTRYYGSKRKLLDKIWTALDEHNVRYNSVLDLFGGTGIVSYYMAKKGKDVIYNDILSFNCEIVKALLCTPKGVFSEKDALQLLKRFPEFNYDNIIADEFDGIYYTPDENRIIDTVIQNIQHIEESKRASAYYILFQSCMIKRPFNIFHRKNLNLRENFTAAKFGNKVTWEQTFHDLFIKFTNELDEFQFVELPNVYVLNEPALECEAQADLVYIDPPYFAKNDNSTLSYHSRYHFLEGLMHYYDIPQNINTRKRNLEINIGKNDEFEKRSSFIEELDRLIEQYQNSTIALSYTTEGYPSVNELENVVKRYKHTTYVCNLGLHGFALNRNNAMRQEVLIIGTD